MENSVILRLLLSVLMAGVVLAESQNQTGSSSAPDEYNLLAKLSGSWWIQDFADYSKDPIGTFIEVYTLSRTGKRLVGESKSQWPQYPKGPPETTFIFVASVTHRCIFEYVIGEKNFIGAPLGDPDLTVDRIVRGQDDDLVWLMPNKRIRLIRHREDKNTSIEVRLPKELRVFPYDLKQAKLRARWNRIVNPSQQALATLHPTKGKEYEVLSKMAGTWIDTGIDDAIRRTARTNTVVFTPSASGQRFVMESTVESDVTHVLVSNPEKQRFQWYQISETSNPEKPQFTALVGELNEERDSILWRKKGQPDELWQLADTSTILRLTPAKDDPFDVKKGVLRSRWVREKKAEPGGKP